MIQHNKSRTVTSSSLIALLMLPLSVGCTDYTDSKIETTSNSQPQTSNELQKVTKPLSNVEKPTTEPEKKSDSASSNTNTLDCQKIDKDLSENLKMSTEKSEELEKNVDLVVKSNHEFRKTLIDYAQKDHSMQCKFPLASAEGLSIKTSEDNNFRAFSWNENTGGTMHYYAGLYQFKDTQGNMHTQGMNAIGAKIADDEYAADDGIPNALYTVISNGKAQYMIAATEILSNKDRNESLRVFTANGDKLKPSNIIKTKSLTNKLRFQYDFFSVVDRPERPIQLFEYDQQTKTIRFPVVIDDEKYPSGKVTDDFISYKFDGKHFQRVKS